MLSSLFRVLLTRSLKPFRFEGRSRWSETPKRSPAAPHLGLYVHIPFCTSLCPFCPYFKERFSHKKSVRFVDSLLREIESAGSQATEPTPMESLYFGGGSPALLRERLAEIVVTVRRHFNLENRIGVELHPRDVDRTTIRCLREAGCTMVSLGVQSFNADSLAALQRESCGETDKLKMLAEAEFQGIDVDLIFGIPGQTASMLADDFRRAVETGATQISTYPMIDFSYAANKRKPQGRSIKKTMLDLLIRTAGECGFERTSVWTFAKRDTPKYSSVTRDNFIGFGPSATTLLRDGFSINTFSVEEYCSAIEERNEATALSIRFATRQREVYWLFWSAYNLRIDADSFRELFDRELDDVFGWELWFGCKFGYLRKNGGNYELTRRGAYLFHLFEQKYTLQYIDKTWRAAGETPWPNSLDLY